MKKTENGTKSAIWGRDSLPHGKAPAIALVNPSNPHNVSMIVRLASCYGMEQVWFTGERVKQQLDDCKKLPREERMKGYKDVDIINYDFVFDQFPKEVTPVAIEVRENSEPLHLFEHPENPLYVFGPEDGSIDNVLLRHCHRFVVIPTRHCLNLATAVSTVLWDRMYKRYLNGQEEFTTPGEFESRGVSVPPKLVF